ncbi:MAG: hypothetical protein HY713_14105 [candidate division NC10 bacterium]|nr:hypothetical protein [candidate division NC10 bacterium]
MKTHRERRLVLGIGAALCLAGLLLLLTTRVEAGCDFPASGQTTAYTADKNGNPGAAVPDDGTVQAGKALRYEDKGKGWVRDKVTRLIWEKKSDDGGLHDKDNAYPWSSDSTDTIWDWLDDVNT